MKYPGLVARIQEIDPLISGGTTAVVAILINNMLYVANTGDSRAVLVQQLDDEMKTTVSSQVCCKIIHETIENPFVSN